MDLGSGLNKSVFQFICLTDLPSDSGKVASLLFFFHLQSKTYVLFPSLRHTEVQIHFWRKHREAEWEVMEE